MFSSDLICILLQLPTHRILILMRFLMFQNRCRSLQKFRNCVQEGWANGAAILHKCTCIQENQLVLLLWPIDTEMSRDLVVPQPSLLLLIWPSSLPLLLHSPHRIIKVNPNPGSRPGTKARQRQHYCSGAPQWMRWGGLMTGSVQHYLYLASHTWLLSIRK